MHLLIVEVVMSACLVMTMHAADMELTALHIDDSPVGFMDRLLQAERGRPEQEENVFNHIVNSDEHFRLLSLANFMQAKGCGAFYDYLYALATNKRIDERKKVDDAFVLIPYFQSLKDQGQEKKNAELLDFCQENVSYPLKRLLFAGFAAIGADMNKVYETWIVRGVDVATSPFMNAALKHDIILMHKLLQCGADPNYYHPKFGTLLMLPLAHEEVVLALDYGANIQRQHRINDLIIPFCSDDKRDTRIMQCYLQHISPHVVNEFGFAWLKILKERAMHFDNDGGKCLIERLSLLLDHAEYYDAEALIPHNAITFGSFLPAAAQKEIFQTCLQQHARPSKKQHIVRALRMQQISGRSLRKQGVSVDTHCLQAIKRHNKKRKKVPSVAAIQAALHHTQPWPVPEQGLGFVSGVYEADYLG